MNQDISSILIQYEQIKKQIIELKNNSMIDEAQTKANELNSFVRQSSLVLSKYIEEKLKFDFSPYKKTEQSIDLMTKVEFLNNYDFVNDLVKKQKLENEINEEDFNQLTLVISIIKDYYLPDLKDIDSKKIIARQKKNFTNFITACLIIALVIILGINARSMIIKSANSEKIESLLNIAEPSQNSTTGGTTINVKDTDIKIEFIAEYSITGRVVSTMSFIGQDIRSKFSPKDIGLAWDVLSDKETDKKVKWSTLKSRFLSYVVYDNGWVNEMGGFNRVTASASNNHLIPANNEIKKLIKLIGKNDYIRIEGYLVNVSYEENGRDRTIPTSLSRTDSGNGACEQIYVTSVNWLKT